MNDTRPTASPVSAPASIDTAIYATASRRLKASIEQMLAAGRSPREVGQHALQRFGDAFLPYLQKFARDVAQGRIEIWGLAHSARGRIFGHQVNGEEREHMIREAAYYRAERRGFASGLELEDWLEAEREIDAQLSVVTGPTRHVHKTLDPLPSLAEKELVRLEHHLFGHLQDRAAAPLQTGEPSVRIKEEQKKDKKGKKQKKGKKHSKDKKNRHSDKKQRK